MILILNNTSKSLKFSVNTKLCHKVRNTTDITELHEDINKLIGWANKCQVNFNVEKCFAMHIGHNNIYGNYNMFNKQLSAIDKQ